MARESLQFGEEAVTVCDTCILHGRSVHQECVGQQLPVQSQQVDTAQTVQQSVWKEAGEDNHTICVRVGRSK